MLGLQSIVRNLPFLQKALAGTRSQLLQIAYEVFVLPLYLFVILAVIPTQDALG